MSARTQNLLAFAGLALALLVGTCEACASARAPADPQLEFVHGPLDDTA
jgi:hypothetical protein